MNYRNYLKFQGRDTQLSALGLEADLVGAMRSTIAPHSDYVLRPQDLYVRNRRLPVPFSTRNTGVG